MIEVMPDLFVGSQDDYEGRVKGRSDWSVVQACKEPYHRQALGYSGRAAAKTHPEYLVARRGNRIILNMVDSEEAKYFSKEIFDPAISFIKKNIGRTKVLVHCNQGQSRAPSIAMLYMAIEGLIPNESFAAAEAAFRKIYSGYSPAAGIRQFIKSHWAFYVRDRG